MDEKIKKEKEAAQAEKEAVQQEQSEAIGAAVTAAVEPLQREISSLKVEVRKLKEVTEKPSTAIATAVIDDKTRDEIRGMMASAAAGIDSYKIPVCSLFAIMIVFAGLMLWFSHRLNNVSNDTNWRIDVITGILSGDRHYWWDGENYEASRKAPETKRLENALEYYKKITSISK